MFQYFSKRIIFTVLLLLSIVFTAGAAVEVQSNGTTVKKVETLNFVGSSVSASGNTATISGGGGGTSLSFGCVIGSGTEAITTGVKATAGVTIPVDATITDWTILSCDDTPTTGSIVFDIWKDSYTNYPPTVADTITASAKPTLSSSTKATSSTLTGWTTSLSAGDIIYFNVDSVTSLTCAKLIVNATID